MNVSKSVTKEEWEKAYAETLYLVEKFPLVNIKEVKIEGLNTLCLVPTKEEVFKSVWSTDIDKRGWETVGDAISLKTAENYFYQGI